MKRQPLPMIAPPDLGLDRISDDDLMQRMEIQNRNDRRSTLRALLHLIEVDRRKSYRARGYFSLYDYCTRGLLHSESAAWRRIRTARCIRDYPEVYGLLYEGYLNPTTVTLLASVLTPQNADTLLREACGKSRREVEILIAPYKPDWRPVRDRVTPVSGASCSRRSARDGSTWQHPWDVFWDHEGTPAPEFPEPEGDVGAERQWLAGNGSSVASDASDKWQETYRRCEGEFDPTEVVGQLFKIEFAAGSEFVQKLEEVKALLSARDPRGPSLARLFERVMDEFLDRHSPARRAQRRAEASASRSAKDDGACEKKAPSEKPAPRSRYIAPEIKDAVYLRDGGRCTFASKNGVRCEATQGLQFDHTIPYAMGGTSTADNLRLLCATHNLLAAETVFGTSHIRQFHKRE